MSQSKLQARAFGKIQVFDHQVEDWIYLRPPELGDIKFSVQKVDHNGWLLCDGRSLGKVEDSKLYGVIGDMFGGTRETFNLPDARGRVLGCAGEGIGLTKREIGKSVGEERHILTVDELPRHTHKYVRQDGTQHIAAAGGGSLTAADEVTKEDETAPMGGGQGLNVMQPTLFAGNVFIWGGQ